MEQDLWEWVQEGVEQREVEEEAEWAAEA